MTISNKSFFLWISKAILSYWWTDFGNSKTFIEKIEVGEKILPPGIKVCTHDIPFRQRVKIYYRFIGDVSDDSMRAWNQSETKKAVWYFNYLFKDFYIYLALIVNWMQTHVGV